MYDYDKLITYIGVSPYLIFLVFCTSLQIWPAGLNNMGPMFLQATPEHHVKQEWFTQLVQSNCTDQYTTMWNTTKQIHYAGLAMTSDQLAYDKCKLYAHTNQQLEEIINAGSKALTCPELYQQIDEMSHQYGSVNETQTGSEIWYGTHKSGMFRTLVTDFDLVCDKAGIDTLIRSSYMAGFALGAMVFGPLSDNMGRKWVMQITSVGAFIADIAIVFSVRVFS